VCESFFEVLLSFDFVNLLALQLSCAGIVKEKQIMVDENFQAS
jgi:hypothetical protein